MMFPITRAQRRALFIVFQRDFPGWISPTRRKEGKPCQNCGHSGIDVKVPSKQWRRFRSTVKPTFFCDGSITVPWAGMWLCIETNGYTHS